MFLELCKGRMYDFVDGHACFLLEGFKLLLEFVTAASRCSLARRPYLRLWRDLDLPVADILENDPEHVRLRAPF